MAVEVNSDRRFRLDADRLAVWDAIRRIEDYRRWWPWLRQFDANRLEVGGRWRCTVRPPVPYELRFVIELIDVVAPEHIVAAISGDITGTAELTLDAVDAATEVRLVSSLVPRRGVLVVVARLAPWLAEFGHDWVLDAGLSQFRTRAL